MGERAADRAAMPHLRIADLARPSSRRSGSAPASSGSACDRGMARERADRELRAGVADVGEIGEPPDVDELRRPRDPELHRRQRASARPRAPSRRHRVAEQLDRMLDRLGDLVVERCRDHDFASSIARQTRSGVAGIWMSVTPRCESASTHGVDHRRGGRDRAGLPHALHAERVRRSPWLSVRSSSYDGQLGRRRARGTSTSVRRLEVAVLVVDRLLVQRRRDALRDAAVHLPVDDQRVDDRADVVDRDVADRAARRPSRCRPRRPPRGRRRARRSSAGRTSPSPRGPAPSRPAGCAPRTPPTRRPSTVISLSGEPLTRERAVRVLEVVGRDLELVRDDLARLLDDLLARRSPERDAADREAPAAVRVEAVAARSLVSPCSTSTSSTGRSRAGRRRSATTPSRGPGRAARCR